MRAYGRKPSPPDARDWKPERLFAMVAAGQAIPALPVSWQCDVWLNQLQTPHCVGFAGAYFEATADAVAGANDAITNADGEKLYYLAKIEDGEPGQENGSCGRSLAKALQKLGVIDHYSLTSDPVAITRWMATQGPVLFGVPWYSDMEDKDANGYVHATGDPVGGHEIMGRAVESGDKVLRNSWGQAWGECKISDADLRLLLAEQGDALLTVKLVAPVQSSVRPSLLVRFLSALLAFFSRKG